MPSLYDIPSLADMPDLVKNYQASSKQRGFTNSNQAKEMRKKASQAYGDMVASDDFGSDQAAQQLAHRMRAAGLVVDPTQGGLASSGQSSQGASSNPLTGNGGLGANPITQITKDFGGGLLLPRPKVVKSVTGVPSLDPRTFTETLLSGNVPAAPRGKSRPAKAMQPKDAPVFSNHTPTPTIQATPVQPGSDVGVFSNHKTLPDATVSSPKTSPNSAVSSPKTSPNSAVSSPKTWTGKANPKNGTEGSDIFNDSKKFGDVIDRPVINGITQATFTKIDPMTGKPIQRYYDSVKEGGRRLGTGDDRVAGLIGASHPGYNDVVNDELTKWAGPDGIIPTYGAKFADMAAKGLVQIRNLPHSFDSMSINEGMPQAEADRIYRENKRIDNTKPNRYEKGFSNLVAGSITTPVQIGYAATQDANALTNSDPVRRQASAQSADAVVKGMIGSIAQAPNLDPHDPRSQQGWFMQMMRAEDLAKQGDHAGALVALQNSGNAIKKAIKDDPINAGATLAGIGLFGLKGFHDVPANYGELASTLQRGSALASKLGAPDIAGTMRQAAAKTAVKGGLISIGRTPVPPDLQPNRAEAPREAPANAGASSALRPSGDLVEQDATAMGAPPKNTPKQDVAAIQTAREQMRQQNHASALNTIKKTLERTTAPWYLDPGGFVKQITARGNGLEKMRGAITELAYTKAGEYWRNQQTAAAARGDWDAANQAGRSAVQMEKQAANLRSTRAIVNLKGKKGVGGLPLTLGKTSQVNTLANAFLDSVGEQAKNARITATGAVPGEVNVGVRSSGSRVVSLRNGNNVVSSTYNIGEADTNGRLKSDPRYQVVGMADTPTGAMRIIQPNENVWRVLDKKTGKFVTDASTRDDAIAQARQQVRSDAKGATIPNQTSQATHTYARPEIAHPEVYDRFGHLIDISGYDQFDNAIKAVIHEHHDHLRRIPPQVAKMLNAAGLKGIYIGEGGVPYLDNMQHLQGVQPRGYPPGETWNNVHGAYVPGKRYVIIGAGRHGSKSVILHEFGHALGDRLGYNDDKRLIEAHKRLYPKLPNYLQQNGPGTRGAREELLAEGLAHVLMDPVAAAKEYDPEFVSFIQNVVLKGKPMIR
jgi:hypothetical protein